MKYVRSFKLYEELDPTTSRYHKCEDRISPFDQNKMDKILEKDHKHWTDEDKKFMTKMSKKGVYYIDDDGNRYTEKELKDKGIDIDSLERAKKWNNDTKEVISKASIENEDEFHREISEIVEKSKAFIVKYSKSRDVSDLDAVLRKLTSEIEKLK